MAKIHTRQRRGYSLSTRTTKRRMSNMRRKRPKSFYTEESAHKWAEAHGHKKGGYELVKAKKGKKFQVKKI